MDAIHCALDCGITTFDTAPMYSDGQAEGLLGHALSGVRRQAAQVITKINPWDATRDGIAGECEGSLRRIGTDWIDLYLVHWRGPVPLEETVDGLERLRRQGKIRDWGVSNFDQDDARAVVALRPDHLPPLVNQVLFNPRRREAEPRLQKVFTTVALMAYSPFERDRTLDFSPFADVALRHGCEPRAAVLAWILRKGITPVFKAARADHVRANATAMNVDFLPAELHLIDFAFPCPQQPVRIERDDIV